MGFFSKLFEKKQCDICGGEIGLLGNRKLEDGNLCKDCAKKLSPWFDDRRHSTVEQISAQLKAREANRAQLQSFHHQVALGADTRMYIELRDGVPSRFVVSDADDYREDNADILTFAQISSCTPDIQESRTELMRTNDQGEEVSYNPPRFEYSYDFCIELTITGCPYIDDIRFQVNRNTLNLETVLSNRPGSAVFDPMTHSQYREQKAILDAICEYVSCGQRGVAYTDVQAPSCQQPVQQPAPVAWTCFCGTENNGRFCPNCGKRFGEEDLERSV